MEDVEISATSTVDKQEELKEVLHRLNNLLKTEIDEMLPLSHRNRLENGNTTAPNKSSPQSITPTQPSSPDRFSSLPWISKGKPNFSFIVISPNPTGLEKELIDLIRKGGGKHFEGHTKYKIGPPAGNGVCYLQRWKNEY
jgi:hypothetical protein